ncbi:hypothetical protein ACFZDG_18405 [Kitasatospora xanthocidica]|uniref:hypothetical protein n=1 Tax=Kitasatospora xanthocidica TaxID=83382 RepID=UPI0036E8B0E3
MTTIQRRVAERLSTGSARVARGLSQKAIKASTWTKVVGGVASWKGLPVLVDAAHHQPLIPAGAAALWTWAAWKAGAPKAPEKASQQPAATEATEPEETAEAGDEQAEFLALLHELMPGATPGRDDRIHLAQIATAWTGEEGADTAPVRALLAEAGIPTTACRVPGRGSSTGIYLRDLPPLPHPSREPLPPVVGGPDQQQQHQQRSETARREGFWTKPHPHESNRTIIDWENAS